MRAKIVKILLLVLLVPVIYWSATASMIEYSARYVSTPHGCLVYIPFHHTKFLMSMGQRSVPALHRQIANPSVGMNSKIHLAWILESLGDNSEFQVFIEGLNSKKSTYQYIASVRMRDFPEECLQQLPAILDAGRQKQHLQYEGLLWILAYKANLSDNKKAALSDIIDTDKVRANGLSRQQIQSIMQLFRTSA